MNEKSMRKLRDILYSPITQIAAIVLWEMKRRKSFTADEVVVWMAKRDYSSTEIHLAVAYLADDPTISDRIRHNADGTMSFM
jgi:hypothetical protein